MAENANDQRVNASRKVGPTILLQVGTLVGAQTSDAVGALPAGRYRIMAINIAAGGRVWVRAVPFAVSTPPVVKGYPVGVGDLAIGNSLFVPEGILDQATGTLVMELNVKRGFSDRIEAIGAPGNATLAITLVGQ